MGHWGVESIVAVGEHSGVLRSRVGVDGSYRR